MHYRSLTDSPVEIRSEGDQRAITGYAAVFNSPSNVLKDYREIVNPSAFDRTLREINEGKRVVSARIQHEGGLSTVGSTANGSLKLSTDAKGLKYEIVALPNTQAGRDILELVSGGYITKSSFAFIVPDKSRDLRWDFNTFPPTRELLNVDLVDVAPVDGPAYEATTVQARAMVVEEMREMSVPEKRAGHTRVEMRQLENGSTFAELHILDEIVPTWMSRYMEDAVSSGKVIEALAAVPDPERIDVYINSPGGDVYEGMAIYNTLKDHPAPVNIYVRGLAASMASVISMAGDTIIMGEGAFMMIHNAWTVTAGNASELRSDALRLDKIDNSLAETYAKRSGMEAKAAKKLMDKETWFTAQEAVDAGLADRIGGQVDTEGIEAVAKRCRELEYRNVPAHLGTNADVVERRRDLSADELLEITAIEKRKAV